MISIDEPRGQPKSNGYATAGWVAAPAVGRVIADMAALEGLMPQTISPADDPAAGLRRYVKAEVIHE
jgi:cell division protein FtsI (penicillin-binding protein 3)